MRLYHGSNLRINRIDLSKSKAHKDFGKGFYLTQDYNRAVKMANRTFAIEATGTPEVKPFLFNLDSSKRTVKVKIFSTTSAEWALFVMNNRDKSNVFKHDYDIVIGPVADSRVDAIIQQYREEFKEKYTDKENLRKLAHLLKYPGKEYIQFCFCTPKAINLLILDI